MLALLWIAVSIASAARPDFLEQRVVRVEGDRLRGASRDGDKLYAWGNRLWRWDRSGETLRPIESGPFGEGGCVFGGGLVLQEGEGLGRLILLDAKGRRQTIDSGVEMHDCLAATLFGRRGVLLVHRYGQVRFYEPGAPWRYREIYSFYTPSQQAGLALADVDGDSRTDILCGNYWIRSPDRFELPWRLFAINTWSESPLSAMLRVAPLDGGIVASQGEMAGARLAWFERPADPKQSWIEHRMSDGLDLQRPHALTAADFDGDGRTDFLAAENNGPKSRVFVFWNEGEGNFHAEQIAAGYPAFAAWAVESGMLLVGLDRIVELRASKPLSHK